MVATLDEPETLSAIEAVNIMLRAYGEARITALGEHADAVKAEQTLIQTMFQESVEGYRYCTAQRKTFIREEDGRIVVPGNVAQFIPTGPSFSLDVIVKSGYLFNRKDDTDVFDEDVEADVSYALPWDELPQAAKWFLAYRAAISFVSAEKPGDPVLQELQRQALAAKGVLEQFDKRLRRGTLTENNPHFFRMRKRRRRSL